MPLIDLTNPIVRESLSRSLSWHDPQSTAIDPVTTDQPSTVDAVAGCGVSDWERAARDAWRAKAALERVVIRAGDLTLFEDTEFRITNRLAGDSFDRADREGR